VLQSNIDITVLIPNVHEITGWRCRSGVAWL